ncbi:MAG: DUF4878 domain-containing protein [Bacteroidales bacterium]|nr:DUF4878 domain-containing protein [Bacteroidales bacterium]
MKKYIVSAFVAVVLLSGCTSNTDKAVSAAAGFLEAYFDMDYQKAAGYATGDVEQTLALAGDNLSQVPEHLRQRVEEASRATSFRIISATLAEDKSHITVEYELHPFNAGKNSVLLRTMVVEKRDGAWKVARLNEPVGGETTPESGEN